MLDFFVYKTCGSLNSPKNLSHCQKLLQFTERLQAFESSKFIIDTCKYYKGQISQFAAQRLRQQTTIKKNCSIHKLYHRHLQDGIAADVVSGWLLYASYYYVTGQYDVRLRLTDYILSRCKHGTVKLGCVMYNDEQINI